MIGIKTSQTKSKKNDESGEYGKQRKDKPFNDHTTRIKVTARRFLKERILVRKERERDG